MFVATTALGQKPNIRIVEAREGKTYTLSAKLEDCLDATITLTCKLNNLTPSVPLPLTVDSAGRKEFELVRLTVTNPNMPANFSYGGEFKLGGMLTGSRKEYAYRLPYLDARYRVTLGPRGGPTHGAGTENEEAIDWAMPIGTKVYPARPGIVVAFRSDCPDNRPGQTQNEEYNFLVIRHEDGTYAEYQHLTQDGVLVKLGDKVTEKDPIALSGNSGVSSAPHLHLVVFANVSGSKRRSLAIEFKRPSGEVGPLVMGRAY